MTSEALLGPLLLTELPEPRRAELAAFPDLESHLRALVAAAVAAWPQLEPAPERFIAHLAGRLAASDAPVELLAQVHAADLYLAAACLNREPVAIALFEWSLLPEARKALRGMSLAPAVIEEVTQAVRCRVLVGGEDGRPLVADYGGLGPLRAWLRAIAVHAALKVLRSEKKLVDDEDVLLALPSSEDDPELKHLKERYAADFKVAFAQAFAALSHRERNLLRQQLLDGLTLDELATLYHVHRATVARWLGQARSALLQGTRRELGARLGVERVEVESIMRLVRSRLDISIRSFLAVTKR